MHYQIKPHGSSLVNKIINLLIFPTLCLAFGVFLMVSRDNKRANFDKKDERFDMLLQNTSSKMFRVYMRLFAPNLAPLRPVNSLQNMSNPAVEKFIMRMRYISS